MDPTKRKTTRTATPTPKQPIVALRHQTRENHLNTGPSTTHRRAPAYRSQNPGFAHAQS